MTQADLGAIARISAAMAREENTDAVLRRLVDGVAELLSVTNVSVRLLDETRTLLIASARAGTPFHANPHFEFVTGEGLLGWVQKHAQTLRLDDAESDPRFAPRPDQKKSIASFLAAPILERGACVGVLSAADESPARFTEAHETLLGLLAEVCGAQLRCARLLRLLGDDERVVALPEGRLPDDAVLATVEPLSALIVDLDALTTIKGRFGLGYIGDLMRSVAANVADVVRRGDVVVRRGESEVIVIFPQLTVVSAIRVAERIRRSVEAVMESTRAEATRLTVSIGVVEREPGETRDAFLGRARVALERGKERGGNRVEVG
ncbi:MAG: diguanylate cyclase [Polyangiales bacterium]